MPQPPDDGIVVVMTVDEYFSEPETLRRRELVWGVVREPPSPYAAHQGVATALAARLYAHVLEHDLGTVLVSPMDVVLDEERALVVQPDVMFISRERGAIVRDFVRGAPDLVVEVASPGTYVYDRNEKVRWYGQYGVRECWLVDPQGSVLTVIALPAQSGVAWTTFARGDRVRSAVLPALAHTVADLLGPRIG
ncbi:MAG TPA: Uma2 family endonuclease [Vicinamibacterales bacterium]